MKRTWSLLILALLLFSTATAQETFTTNGVRDQRMGTFALTNATIHIDSQTTIEKGTLLIRDGEVVAAAEQVTIPEDATVLDMQGKRILASFIDLYSHYGVEQLKDESGSFWASYGRGPEKLGPQKDGAYNANDAIKADYRAGTHFSVDKKAAKKLRKLGFGAVLTFRAEGLARGTGALATTGEGSDNQQLLVSDAATFFSFDKGQSKQPFPISTMGFMALLRQTQFDAQWYANQDPKPFQDLSLEAWNTYKSLPAIFSARNWKDVLRVAELNKDLQRNFIVKEDGDSYQRIDEIKASGRSLVVSLDFPNAPDVEDPIEARHVSLSELKHWELAASNAARLHNAGIPIAFTAHGLKDGAFYKNLSKAIEAGLPAAAALKALTETPAQWLGMGSRLGHLKPGAVANFLIVDGDLFDEEMRLLEHWVQGDRHVLKKVSQPTLAGRFEIDGLPESAFLVVDGKPGAWNAKIELPESSEESEAEPVAEQADEDEAPASSDVASSDDAPAEESTAADAASPEKKTKGTKAKLALTDNWLTLSFDLDDKLVQLSGWFTAQGMQGRGRINNGDWFNWTGKRVEDEASEDSEKSEDDAEASDKEEETEALGPVIFPFVAYGQKEVPQQRSVLFKNVTVWTLDEDGKLENADVLILDGKIAKVGQNLSARDVDVIDGTGKHLTPGIIDEHSHIALDAVNDVATNSGMVRMADVVDSEDINIYRQIAGGVTAAQLLHGSANPVGGQSAIIKLRWGASPAEMLIKDAKPFIKFALGENVKRSSNNFSIRYPQTRMGVEQFYRDAFSAAKDYVAAHEAYKALSKKEKAKNSAPRRDLVLDAMAEILAGTRFITCHSYVQSEILMLMRVAEDFDFRINTFTHILEGYKVAPEMAAHGVGGSTFSDWWNYKWEVRYAIPYNPFLMHKEGVVTAINSDDAEMARRLPQEAAKSIKYGGMDEVDALRMVTLNPAKLLQLDHRMGSIEEGKDADVVLWSDHPLSVYAKVEKTLIDGAVYFDAQRNQELADFTAQERSRLISKARSAASKGSPTQKPKGKKMTLHCDTIYLGDHAVEVH